MRAFDWLVRPDPVPELSGLDEIDRPSEEER